MNGRRVMRFTGTLLLAAGVAVLVWVLVVWRWQDPFTALYTTWKQHQLSQSYERRAELYRLPDPKSKAAASRVVTTAQIRALARRYRLGSKRGQAVGRIRVPRLGLSMIVVDGTDHDTLKKGPGLDRRTYMPGEGQLVYIAGHRTTYLAPFAHIERMKTGDEVSLELPYGTFRYRVFTHKIVAADDMAVLKSHGRDVVELQACHPRFFSSHRYIVFARLTQIDPRAHAGRRAAGFGAGLAEPEVAHRRSGGELAVATWEKHERVSAGGRSDHVRFLASQRLELGRAVVTVAPSCAGQLVADRVPLRGDREPPGLEPGQRVGVALQRQHCRPDEELEGDERRDRVTGQAEHERPLPHAERDRLAGLHGDAPEDLLDAELGLDRTDEVVRADRHAAGGHEQVVFEPACQRLAVGVLVVGDRREALDGSACRPELRLENQPVRLVDLARLERLARTAKLSSRGQHRGARHRSAHDLGHACRGERTELRGAERRSRRDDLVTRAQIAAARTHVRTRRDRLSDLDAVFIIDNNLERDHGIRAVGDDTAGRDSHRLAGLERLR
jgi:sortase A